MCAGRLSPCVRAALDLTVMLMDLDVTGIFFIVLTFEGMHFGIRWYVVCCGTSTWPQAVSWLLYAASGEFGKDGALLVLCSSSWGGTWFFHVLCGYPSLKA